MAPSTAEKMVLKNHLFTEVQYLPSPNFNERSGVAIELLVIHNISLPPDIYGGHFIEQFFLNRLDTKVHPYFQNIAQLKVSAHLLIKRSGEIIQFVPFDKCAWHAGQADYQGRKNCNDFSIGIELEGSDTIAYEVVQYQQLNSIIAILKQAYPILDIVGHNELAPGRKTDPGSVFDWQQIGINK